MILLKQKNERVADYWDRDDGKLKHITLDEYIVDNKTIFGLRDTNEISRKLQDMYDYKKIDDMSAESEYVIRASIFCETVRERFDSENEWQLGLNMDNIEDPEDKKFMDDLYKRWKEHNHYPDNATYIIEIRIDGRVKSKSKRYAKFIDKLTNLLNEE